MLFSIITVTRNNLEGLRRTHVSLRAQSYADYEWIIIDGASSDGTVNYLEGLAARSWSEPDEGIYDAMNKGLARARGDYLLLMNAGDSFAAPDVLQKIADAIRAQPMPPAFI
jgi:putative colanic acid biosynthesis glycosyltransferase